MENHLRDPAPKPDQDPEGKSWSPVFSRKNRKRWDRNFHACRQEAKVERDLLDTFLQDTDHAVPSHAVEQARRFFNNGPQGEIARRYHRAWVECRRKLADGRRSPPDWLDPDQLSTFLENRVRKAFFMG